MPAAGVVVQIRCEEYAGCLHRLDVHPTELGTHPSAPPPTLLWPPAPRPELFSLFSVSTSLGASTRVPTLREMISVLGKSHGNLSLFWLIWWPQMAIEKGSCKPRRATVCVKCTEFQT